ncbi:hypothetical protein JCM10207_000831 [Rhodosporidiobolus poonsookiae]
MHAVSLITGTLLAAQSALAWGAAGHEIVATLAEIHLHPSILAYLRSPSIPLLPPFAKGHLAPVASWADRIRMNPEYRGWSGPLHYSGWTADHPPDACAWPAAGKGDGEGWNSDKDVLHAIANYTTRLDNDPTDWSSFNFLLHFLGDVHQPMHLTSRERGGNGDPVLWEGRRTNLHSLWDGLLIARTLREQSNYTRPLPSPQIESALNGAIYDPYIRLLLWEGVRSWYRASLPEWLDCGAFSSPSLSSSSLLPADPHQLTFSSPAEEGEGEKELKKTVCPLRWATETHRVTCALAFPEGYDDHKPPVEIGRESEFWKKIKDDHTLARLLLQGGLRLAATLNVVLAAPARAWAEQQGWVTLLERDEAGPLNLGWVEEAERRGW